MVDGVRSTSKTTGVFSSPSGSIDASDSTEIAPWASTPLVTIPVLLSTLLAPILAVVSLSTTLTATAAPTPAPPLLPPIAAAPAAAMFCRPISPRAVTSMSPEDWTSAPSKTSAVVSMVTTLTPTPPATAVLVPLLPFCCAPAPAMPQTMKSFDLPAGVTASTVMPSPCTTAESPMRAVL